MVWRLDERTPRCIRSECKRDTPNKTYRDRSWMTICWLSRSPTSQWRGKKSYKAGLLSPTVAMEPALNVLTNGTGTKSSTDRSQSHSNRANAQSMSCRTNAKTTSHGILDFEVVKDRGTKVGTNKAGDNGYGYSQQLTAFSTNFCSLVLNHETHTAAADDNAQNKTQQTNHHHVGSCPVRCRYHSR